MASAGSHIAPRDGEAGSNPNLTTGAIAGIACGAGALFLGAAGLFIIYWRRQRQYDREDNSDQESFDERTAPRNMAPVVTYTLDYKMDDPQHHEGDGEGEGSSYTYSPEKPSYAFSPLGAPDTASAMPTHPAYIPRALVRGSTPSNRSAATTPFPSPPFSSSTATTRAQSGDTAMQSFAAAASGRSSNRTTQETAKLSRQSDSSSSGLPSQPRLQHQSRQSPAHLPPSSTNDTTTAQSQSQSQSPQSTGRKPRAYIPPRLNLSPAPSGKYIPEPSTQTQAGPTAPAPAPAPAQGIFPVPAPAPIPAPLPSQYTIPRRQNGSKPLQGKETTTISGPLAFPEHCHPPIPHPGYNNPPNSGGSRKTQPEEEEHDPYFYHYDGDQSDTYYQQQMSQQQQRRTFRSRAMSGEDRENSREGGGGKGKKHARKKSDRNSGGGGGGFGGAVAGALGLGGGGGGGGSGSGSGGNRHYAEIEIGRGSDIW